MWHPPVPLTSPAIPAPLCIACQIANTSPAAETVSAGAAAAAGMVTPAADGNPPPRVRHGAAVPGHRDAVKTFAEGPIERVPPDQGLASQREYLQKHEDDLPPWLRITPVGLICDFCRAAKKVVSAPGPSVDKNTAWINGKLAALLGPPPRLPCPPLPLSRAAAVPDIFLHYCCLTFVIAPCDAAPNCVGWSSSLHKQTRRCGHQQAHYPTQKEDVKPPHNVCSNGLFSHNTCHH